jgi:uncharacterized protein (TIGR02145 family)
MFYKVIFGASALWLTMSSLTAQCVMTNELRSAAGVQANSFTTCGNALNYHGYDYATVLIGDQCWFAENLRSYLYKNGDMMAGGRSNAQWSEIMLGASAVYGEVPECIHYAPSIDACDVSQSEYVYGLLYNWYAVNDERGLCPDGWHVPTDAEWTELTDVLGGEPVAGGQMKATSGWHDGGNGSNSSGFSGRPGGLRNDDGPFNNAGAYGYWWSSSPSGSDALMRYMYFNTGNVGRTTKNVRDGLSVRCIQD